MAANMDRSLDEILAEKKSDGPRNRRGGRGGPPPRRERQEYPRDGVRKSFRDEPRKDESRNLDSEWVHDRFEDHNTRRPQASRRRRDSPEYNDARGTKLRVENLHYELTEEELQGLFKRIGPVIKLDLRYDRAGRSEGVAFVTYESREDALDAIKEFDGANAAGQPIRLTLLPSGPAPRSRNPFDTAVMPGRPLAERITAPGGRSRSLSPSRHYDEDDAARRGIDRYVPGQGARSRSPMPRRNQGRRPGARRDGGGRDGGRDGGRGGGRDGGGRDQDGGRGQEGGRGGNRQPRGGRPKKTQEELDAEMADYFGGGGNGASGQPANGATDAAVPTDDIDMIE